MRSALEVLIVSQPVLRTGFLRVPDGTTVQVIRAPRTVHMPVIDLSAAQPAEQECEIERAILRDRAEPFSAEDGSPLMRFRWFRKTPNEFELLLSVHHAIDDGWGNQHFLGQLFSLYERVRRGERPSLTPASNVFREFVALEHEMARSEEAAGIWSSWDLQSTGRSCLHRMENAPQHAPGCRMIIGEELLQPLQALSRRLAVSLKSVLLSAYLELIAHELDGARPTVGVVSNGRSDRLSDPLNALGLFWTLAPFCPSRMNGEAAARIRGVQDALLVLDAWAVYPLERIVASHQCEELFFATFNFVDFHNAARVAPDAGFRVLDGRGHDKFHYPLNYLFSVIRSQHMLVVQVEYDNAYFTEAKIAELNTRLLQILRVYGNG
jgi:hypothetical protein